MTEEEFINHMSLRDVVEAAHEMACDAKCPNCDRAYQVELIDKTGQSLARYSGAITEILYQLED